MAQIIGLKTDAPRPGSTTQEPSTIKSIATLKMPDRGIFHETIERTPRMNRSPNSTSAASVTTGSAASHPPSPGLTSNGKSSSPANEQPTLGPDLLGTISRLSQFTLLTQQRTKLSPPLPLQVRPTTVT